MGLKVNLIAELHPIGLVKEQKPPTPKNDAVIAGTWIRHRTLVWRIDARCTGRVLEAKNSSLKEVIQPLVPQRLPCYDFTPVTVHSFGGSLTRLGHRLLEQTTSMV